MVGLRDDAAILPAGSPAVEGHFSLLPDTLEGEGSKRTCNTPTVCPAHDSARML